MSVAAQDANPPHAEPYGWANPLDGGAIDTLAILPRWTALDLSRLGAQLEMDLNAILLDSRTQPGSEGWLETLEKGLNRNPDLIILANFDLGLLPSSLCESIAAAVRDGAGLLLAHDGQAYPPAIANLMTESSLADPPPDFRAGTGADALPDWYDHVTLPDTWVAGEGRIVRMNFRAGFPETHALLPAFSGPGLLLNVYADVYMAYFVRAALWACQRSMEAEIIEAEYLGPEFPDDAEIPPLPQKYVRYMKEQSAHQPVRSYVLRMGAPTDARYDLITRLREFSDRPPLMVQAPERLPAFAKGIEAIPFYMFDRAERGLTDAWLLRNGRVAASWTGYVQRDPRPHIGEVRFNRNVVRPFDTIEASVNLTFPMHRPRPAAIFLQVTTPDGRIVGVGRTFAPPNDGSYIVRAPMLDVDSHRVTASLYVLERESTEDIESAILFAYHRAFSFPVLQENSTPSFGLYLDWRRPIELNTSTLYRTAQTMGARGVIVDKTLGAEFLVGHAGLEPIAMPFANSPWPRARAVTDAIQAAALRGVSRIALDATPPDELAIDDRSAARILTLDAGVDRNPSAPPITALRTLPPLPADLDTDTAGQHARWAVWNAFFDGYGGIVHNHVYGAASNTLATHAALIGPLGQPTKTGQAIADTTRIIGQGLGRTITNRTAPFTRLAFVGDIESETTHMWLHTLWSSGFFPDVFRIDDATPLSRDQYDVAIVQGNLDWPQDATRRIARFAAEGGAIVADTLPNVDYAEVLFGVQASEEGMVATDAVQLNLNETSFAYHNTSGAAPTLLLHEPIASSNEDTSNEIATTLRDFGARPGPRLQVAKEKVGDLRVRAFAVGMGAVIAAIPRPDEGKGPKLSFEIAKGEGHLYYMEDDGLPPRAERKVRVRLEPGSPALLTWLPYEVDELTLVATDAAVAGRRLHATVKVNAEDEATPEGHVARVTLRRLLGDGGWPLEKTIVCTAGVGKEIFTLPRNLPPGLYTLTATDLLTRVETSAQVEVLPPSRNAR